MGYSTPQSGLSSTGPSAAPRGLTQSPTAGYHVRMDLLIVDDNAFQRRVLGRQLRALGHTVREAVDGADGLGLIAAATPDAVFTDLLMPVMDGFAFLGECAVRHPGLPVIVLSADIQTASRERVAALGARGFITKPFTPESLAAALSGLG